MRILFQGATNAGQGVIKEGKSGREKRHAQPQKGFDRGLTSVTSACFTKSLYSIS